MLIDQEYRAKLEYFVGEINTGAVRLLHKRSFIFDANEWIQWCKILFESRIFLPHHVIQVNLFISFSLHQPYQMWTKTHLCMKEGYQKKLSDVTNFSTGKCFTTTMLQDFHINMKHVDWCHSNVTTWVRVLHHHLGPCLYRTAHHGCDLRVEDIHFCLYISLNHCAVGCCCWKVFAWLFPFKCYMKRLLDAFV